MASGKFCALKTNLAIGFIRKNRLECIGKAVMMLSVPCMVKRSNKSNISTYSYSIQPTLKISKFTCISSACRKTGLC